MWKKTHPAQLTFLCSAKHKVWYLECQISHPIYCHSKEQQGMEFVPLCLAEQRNLNRFGTKFIFRTTVHIMQVINLTLTLSLFIFCVSWIWSPLRLTSLFLPSTLSKCHSRLLLIKYDLRIQKHWLCTVCRDLNLQPDRYPNRRFVSRETQGSSEPVKQVC